VLRIYKELGIERRQIESSQAWQNYVETHFNIGRRMEDHAFAQAPTWVEIPAIHDRFFADYNLQSHWAHRHRKDGRRTPQAVLGPIHGVWCNEAELDRLFWLRSDHRPPPWSGAHPGDRGAGQQRTWATRNAKQQYLLRGLLVCGHCGQRMVGGTGRYRCKAGHSVPQQATEDAVTAKLAGLLTNPEPVLADYRALADARSQQAQAAAHKIARLEHAARAIDGERDRLLALYAKGQLDEERWAAKDQELADHQAALQAETAAAAAQRAAALAGVLPFGEVEAACAYYAAQLDTLGPEQWQHLIRLWCVRITAGRVPESADVSVDIEGRLPQRSSPPAGEPGDGAITVKRSGSLSVPYGCGSRITRTWTPWAWADSRAWMMVRLVSRYMVSQIELVASRMGRVIVRTPSSGSTITSTWRTPAPRATRGAAAMGAVA
jgi:hypothetical protein